MNKNAKIANYGLLVWLIPSFITVALSSSLSPINFFEIVSVISIAITTFIFTYLYFMSINENFVKEGILTGVIWFIISIFLDLILIWVGISQLSLNVYVMYIVPLYLIIPVVTIGSGFYMNQKVGMG